MVQVGRPGERVHIHRPPLLHHAFAVIQRVTIEIHHFSGVFQGGDTILFQPVGIDFTRCRMFFNLMVHDRLSGAGFVCFIMTVPAITDQIDHDIALENITEIQGNPGNERHRFRIVGIDVEYRRLHHFGDIGTVLRRAGIMGVGGG